MRVHAEAFETEKDLKTDCVVGSFELSSSFVSSFVHASSEVAAKVLELFHGIPPIFQLRCIQDVQDHIGHLSHAFLAALFAGIGVGILGELRETVLFSASGDHGPILLVGFVDLLMLGQELILTLRTAGLGTRWRRGSMRTHVEVVKADVDEEGEGTRALPIDGERSRCMAAEVDGIYALGMQAAKSISDAKSI